MLENLNIIMKKQNSTTEVSLKLILIILFICFELERFDNKLCRPYIKAKKKL